jgi:hypothetical protein
MDLRWHFNHHDANRYNSKTFMITTILLYVISVFLSIIIGILGAITPAGGLVWPLAIGAAFVKFGASLSVLNFLFNMVSIAQATIFFIQFLTYLIVAILIIWIAHLIRGK